MEIKRLRILFSCVCFRRPWANTGGKQEVPTGRQTLDLAPCTSRCQALREWLALQGRATMASCSKAQDGSIFFPPGLTCWEPGDEEQARCLQPAAHADSLSCGLRLKGLGEPCLSSSAANPGRASPRNPQVTDWRQERPRVPRSYQHLRLSQLRPSPGRSRVSCSAQAWGPQASALPVAGCQVTSLRRKPSLQP